MKKVILISYGEIFLKGKNRPWFLKKLKDLLKKAVSIDKNALVALEDGRFYVKDFDDANTQAIVEKVSKVFGVHSFCVAYEVDKDFDTVAECAKVVAKDKAQSPITFKVHTKRADKRYPINSMDFSAQIGGVLLEEYDNLKVDVNNPDFLVNIEIRQSQAYVYIDKIMGCGGMPVGSSGKCMLLLSGGIDSPVAAYMLAKRGLQVEAVHFYSPPYTSERAKQKVIDLAGIVSDYCGAVKLHIVPFTEIQEQIYEKCHHELLTIIMRRFMMRISEQIAIKNSCDAVATGEALGQVASQTLLSMDATNKSIDMLVLRPLVCIDKLDIIDIANKVGTYETSIQPFEDCCTVFTPKHPATRPKMENIEKNENKLVIDELIKKAVEETYTITV